MGVRVSKVELKSIFKVFTKATGTLIIIHTKPHPIGLIQPEISVIPLYELSKTCIG